MKRGFTLIELLVSMLIFSIVMTAVIAVFVTQHRKTIQVQNVSSLQTDAQVAFEVLKWDLMMAGFGLSPTNNIINAVDGGSNAPDEITIFGLALGYELQTTGFNITLNTQPVPANIITTNSWFGRDTVRNIKKGQYVYGINPESRELVPSLQGVMVDSVVFNSDSTLTLFLDNNVSYLRGTILIGVNNPILLSNGVRYFLDENGVLWRNNVPFLENVEDIQFAYGIDGLNGTPDGEIDVDEWVNDLTGVNNNLIFENKFAIRVTLIVRTRGIPGFDYGRNQIQVENRVINLTPFDRRFDRIILQGVVFPRNLNL
ncbi:MAG: prepilin-type N-terminal cleavage/methylation domain-containing protein [candidate division WOR-3 bacterium]